MSLINDALVDLDNRRHQFPGLNHGRYSGRDLNSEGEVNDQNPIANRSAFLTIRICFIFVVVVTLLGWGGNRIYTFLNYASLNQGSLNDNVSNTSPKNFSINATQPIDIQTSLPFLNNALEDNSVAMPVENSDATHSIKHSSHIQKQQMIDTFLAIAEQSLKDNRLTKPKNINAYEMYKKVIAIAPSNSHALEGVERVKRQYLALIEQEITLGNIDRAHTLLERSDHVDLTLADTAHLYTAIERKNSVISSIETKTEKSLSHLVDNRQNDVYQDAYQKKNTDKKDVEKNNSVIIASRPNTLIKPFRFEKTSVAKEVDVINQVNSMIEDGVIDNAKTLLIDFIGRTPNAYRAEARLFDLYFDLNDIKMAHAVYKKAELSESDFITYMNAKIIYQKRGGRPAIDFMMTNQPKGDGFIAQNAFLAALYQELGEYQKSYHLYHSLLKKESNNTAFWLGFAVSADALNQYQQAISAFEEVINLGGSNKSVNQYAQARLTHLYKKVQNKQKVEEVSFW